MATWHFEANNAGADGILGMQLNALALVYMLTKGKVGREG